jgi:citrate synthase
MTQTSSPSFWVTSVSSITEDDVLIRGYPMQDLVGSLPFSGIAFLIIRGRLPSPGEARMMDVILSSILDYSLQKSGTLAARAVVSVNPQMTAGLAAGVLAAGEYAVSPEDAGRFIAATHTEWRASGRPMEIYANELVSRLRTDKRRVPGFGHPVFRRIDPRAEKLKRIAWEVGIWGEVNDWYEAVHKAFQVAAKKPDLVINDVGMQAAIMVQMGFSPQEMCGIAVLSTFPGLVAHVSEELQSGVRNRIVPDSHVNCATVRKSFVDDMKAAGWT